MHGTECVLGTELVLSTLSVPSRVLLVFFFFLLGDCFSNRRLKERAINQFILLFFFSSLLLALRSSSRRRLSESSTPQTRHLSFACPLYFLYFLCSCVLVFLCSCTFPELTSYYRRKSPNWLKINKIILDIAATQL